MNRKIKNTLVLLGILILISLIGGAVSVYQKKKITEKDKQLITLRSNDMNPADLQMQLAEVKKKAMVLDSVLSRRKYNIPKQLMQTDFYNFVNRVTFGFSSYSHVDIEYLDRKPDKTFNFYLYKISGSGEFLDVYRLIYAIEQSRELKKIRNLSLSANIIIGEDQMPRYVVTFSFNVFVYFANDDRFTSTSFVENSLDPGGIYNIFYPLIRTQLPPNTEELAEVENAKLLALVPDGAYIADSKGNTFMLMEGDPVYLGYLTKIDYSMNQVTFILNKGGIIEKIYLKLEKEDNRKKK